MVPPPRGFLNNLHQVAPAFSGSVCHQVQQQTVTVCIPSSRPTSLDSGCTQSWEDLDPPVAILGKVVEKLQDYPCSRMILIAPRLPNMLWFGDLMAIVDILLNLFQGRKLQPSNIDGYRSDIADKLGNLSINVRKDENHTRLLDSFHRGGGRRDIPSWALSLVMHQLTKAPFEPLKDASLKHLSFKTVFLLALGLGKRRSEIHAWIDISHATISSWIKETVILYYELPDQQALTLHDARAFAASKAF